MTLVHPLHVRSDTIDCLVERLVALCCTWTSHCRTLKRTIQAGLCLTLMLHAHQPGGSGTVSAVHRHRLRGCAVPACAQKHVPGVPGVGRVLNMWCKLVIDFADGVIALVMFHSAVSPFSKIRRTFGYGPVSQNLLHSNLTANISYDQ